MIGLIGYNFCADGKSLDPFPISVKNLKVTKIQNGIYDHFRISSNTQSEYNPVVPSEWDFDTILDCDFNNSIDGGNLSQSISDVTGVRFKRRKKNSFDWITIKQYENIDVLGLNLSFNDNLAEDATDYEYAFVPLSGISGNYQEGNYITAEVTTKFNGVYVCDVNSIFKFYARVAYGSTDRVQQVGTYEVLGQKYPVVVSNGLIDYETGSITGLALPETYDKTRKIDGIEISSYARKLLDFLTNGKPKMIKDKNGNAWLCFITGNPQLTYEDATFNALITTNFTWTQIGDVNNKDDLRATGMIPSEG